MCIKQPASDGCEESQRLQFLGVEVEALTIRDLNEGVGRILERGKTGLIAHHNLHSVCCYRHNDKMRVAYAQADLIHVDGMSLILLARMLGLPLKREHRVTYVDWIDPLLREAVRQEWSIFYLGAEARSLEQGLAELRRRYPELRIEGHDGYFDRTPGGAENEAVIAGINQFKPDILMVGMGMPIQEEWVADSFAQLEVGVILTAGACIDYIAGKVPTPPRWMGRAGLEWLYRLIQEPRRLWYRNFVEPLLILPQFTNEFFRRRLKSLGVPRS